MTGADTITLLVRAHPPVERALTDLDINWGPVLMPEATPDDLADVLVDALIDAQSYRVLASTGIHHAHSLHLELVQLRAQHTRLIEDYRALRASTEAAQ